MDAEEPDEALVERCLAGDPAAFRLLVARYRRPLYNAAFRVTGNAEDASDVTQAAFTEVAERLGAYDPAHRFFSWIYRITVNAALNVARRNRHEASLPEHGERDASPSRDPETLLASAELARRVQAALSRLGEEHRVVLTLRHFSDLSYREMAEVLGLEEKTVKSRLYEARQRLRDLLGDLEGR
jgi:RNA polymerase sigma-70 factor (ECF subfamily)